MFHYKERLVEPMPKYLHEELTGETPERDNRLAWRIAELDAQQHIRKFESSSGDK